MASSGTTTTGRAATLVDDNDDVELTDIRLTDYLDNLVFGRPDSPDDDVIAGAVAGVGLVVDIPNTSTEDRGGARGVEM